MLLFGPPGTGKTLCARAVANRTDACFIRVIGSELVQKYVGEGARMVRELFEMARSKKACLIFFDEIDAIGGARFDDGAGGDNEVRFLIFIYFDFIIVSLPKNEYIYNQITNELLLQIGLFQVLILSNHNTT